MLVSAYFLQGNGETHLVTIDSESKKKFGSFGYMWIAAFNNGTSHYMDVKTIENATGINPLVRNWQYNHKNIAKYNFNGYIMTLTETNKRDSNNHIMVEYTFANPLGEVLFVGNDFGASPLHNPTGKDSAIALLGFFTLQDGDTDSEYFDKYTPVQLQFSKSFDCEALSLIVSDFENPES